jgi:hypothetical protein
MAFPIAAGRHQVSGEYRPPARALYWWAAAALEFSVAGLFAFAWRNRSRTLVAAGPHRRRMA